MSTEFDDTYYPSLKTKTLSATIYNFTSRLYYESHAEKSAALRLQCSRFIQFRASFPVIFTRKTEIKSVSYRVR